MSVQTRSRIPSLILATLAAVVLIAVVAATDDEPSSVNGDVRSYSSLTFCASEPVPSCEVGVLDLDYTLLTRQELFVANLDLPRGEAIDVVVQDVTIEFLEAIDETKFPGDSFFAYHDADADGTIRFARSDRLASATLKGRRLKFENLNVRLRETSIESFAFSLAARLRIAGDGLAELIASNPIDGLEVRAINALDGGKEVLDEASFADLSVHAYWDRLGWTAQEFADRTPGFDLGSDGTIALSAGYYRFDDNVIIPPGTAVKIEAGATIQLAAGKSIVSYSPVRMLGSSDLPITIQPAGEEPFGVFGVIGGIENDELFLADWVTVSGGSEAVVNGAYLSGQLSVYRVGTTEIRNSTFALAEADDGLNIKYSDITLENNSFLQNSADAFDGDFVTGVIESNYFHQNGNDSVDFSGSDVLVAHNFVDESGDKCASVGEASTARIEQNLFDGCAIGIEIKDASSVEAHRNVIVDSTDWAVNAYVKKPFFGVPTFEISDNVLLGNAALYGGLAEELAGSPNVTSGDLEELAEEVSWLQDVLSAVPTR